jgi:uncharacterized cupredoxin-like copper-binding protein
MNLLRAARMVALPAALALTLPASVAAAPAKPSVAITLASHYYYPNPIYLAGGVPVRLVFQNRAGKTHDFSAPLFFGSARILAGRVPNGKVVVGGGRTKVVTLVPARGTYKVHCSHPFHTMLGMSGRIIVS